VVHRDVEEGIAEAVARIVLRVGLLEVNAEAQLLRVDL
jgi:hypothetical protein